MSKSKSIKELLTGGGARLAGLAARARERSQVLEHVCAALPPALAQTIVTAGITEGVLTIGVAGAAWAARLRYDTDSLKAKVGTSTGTPISRIKIKVIPSSDGDR